MPAQRQKNKFDIEHIRAANPNIIYARGSAYGDKGAERDTGGFDGTAFWTRSGVGHALRRGAARPGCRQAWPTPLRVQNAVPSKPPVSRSEPLSP